MAIQLSSTRLRLAAVLGVIAALALAYRLGLFEQFAEPARLKQTLVALDAWGYLAFVAAYATLQPFGLPGMVFVVSASLVWPWPIAFALSMVGTMAASVVGFSFARFVARDWVASKIPARFRKYEEALARRALVTVFVLRLVFWMPPLLHAFFGVSNVRFATHFWGSLLGYLLPLFLVSYFGERLFDVLTERPELALIALAALAIALLVGFWARRRSFARGGRAPAEGPRTRG